MFNFLRKKVKKEDPILKEINRQTEELKAMTDSMHGDSKSLEAIFKRQKVYYLM